MNIQDKWEKALKNTDIIRPRVQGLHTFADTKLSYIFLGESLLNSGDTVVRKGEILAEKPSLVLLSDSPQFEGFDFEQEQGFDENIFVNFLLVRGIHFPSLRYNNKTHSLDVYEGRLGDAIKHHLERLQKEEDVKTGLFTGPSDCWQFSILVFVCSQILRSADGDIQKLLEDFKRKGQS